MSSASTLTSRGKVLHVTLGTDGVRAAQGAMIAFEGAVEFKGAGMGGGQGLRAALKQKVAGESVKLMEASGSGVVYFAQDAADVVVIDLDGDTLQVESEQILAVTRGLRLDVAFTGLRGMTTGQGLATTTLSGQGQAALLSHGPMIALAVAPGMPLTVDPGAYVASLGRLTMSMVSGVSWKSLIGEGSGEPFSLKFDGEGTVFIQPDEG